MLVTESNFLLLIIVLLFISNAQQYLTENSCTWGRVDGMTPLQYVFFCTVACTLIRVADKTDKAAETPAVTYYPAALTADFPLNRQRVGEVRLFTSTDFFLPWKIQEKEFLIKHRLYILNEQICQKKDVKYIIFICYEIL